MKNLTIKLLLVCLFSVTIVGTVHSSILSKGERDIYPDKGIPTKSMIYMAVNIGRVVGNMVITMDDDLALAAPVTRVKTMSSVSSRYGKSDRMAILFGAMALFFLGINMYYGGKIVEFLKSRGRKAHFYALRWMIFSYINQYKKLTIAEDGQTGPYYRSIGVSAAFFFVSISIAVYFAILS